MGNFGATPVTALGVGFNTFLSSAMSEKVDVEFKDKAHSSQCNVYMCTSKQQVFDALGIKADVAVSSLWGSFKDKLEMSQSLQKSATTISIVVVASMVTSHTTATNYTFSTPAPTSAFDLYKSGGDCFVSSLSEGGQYIAAYNFVATDETAYQSLKNTAQAHFKGLSTDVNASFETSISSMRSVSNVETSFNQRAVGFSTTKLPSPDHLVDFVTNFASVSLDGPQILDFETESYSRVQGCPDFTKIDGHRNAYVNPAKTSPGYSDMLLTARTNLETIAAISKIYGYYGMVGIDTDLTTVPIALRDIIDQIGAWIINVDSDPTTKVEIAVPKIDHQCFKLPTAQYALLPGAEAGGRGGPNSFQDVKVDDIAKGINISALQIRGAERMDAIHSWYSYQNPEFKGFDCRHGGNGGGDTPTFNLGPSNLITSFGAYVDSFVNRITIQTTFNPSTVIQPRTNDHGLLFSWSFPQNSVLVGFAGTSG